MIIDADTHVIETERTWDFMEGADRKYVPQPIKVERNGRQQEFWLLDDRLTPRRQNIGADTSEAAREMLDLEGRISHMDQLGVDVQVLFPTMFLRPATTKPEVELALCRAYNRWLAHIWSRGQGRLRWAVMLPLMSMPEALNELRWSKEHGAVAVFMRAFEGERRPADPYFFPLFEEASRLGMPLAFHAAIGSLLLNDMFGDESFSKFKFPVFHAFWSFVANDIPSRFPELRVGFVEASARIPHVIHHLASSLKRQGREVPPDLLRRSRLYVTCQTDDDLDYILRYSGDDNLIIGSDYGHNDTSSELEALRHLKEKGEVPPAVVDKILGPNAAAFYGL
ncbi:MAG TPA: amidohydrolase family protein [Chloroflexota bacterium]|nr:amidohydrolase family protein [Chloroflexota bacterium]